MTDLSGDGVDVPPLRIVTLHALTCGAVSVAAVVAVGLWTADQDWTTSMGPVFISLAVALCAVCVIAALSPLLWMLMMRRREPGAYLTHALAPILLVVLIPVGVAIGGPVRDRWETTGYWAVVTLCVHLALALATRRRLPGLARMGAILSVTAMIVAVVGIERASQLRWRVDDFRALGVPLVVPEIPGFELTYAYPGQPGHPDLFLELSERPARPYGRTVTVLVRRTAGAGYPTSGRVSCWGRADDRLVSSDGSLVYCLAENGFEMHIRSDPQMPSLAPLAPRVTLRRVPAQQLAELPGTDWQRSVGWTTD
ncbi:hypothetical protein [Plantactinospora endophytica]|uniref:Uncharacterized protein n=2 Tax=Plantactinospora endophytica TaxID=673535 RepID=A0ABQ4DZ12_9ACTN|nr:hypothetical protein Pen02_26330 [Plantactinospora endophytica]